MEQGNSIQLSVWLLGYILIARGAELEQKQRKRFLEFVNIFLPPHWWRTCWCLQLAPGLREDKVRLSLPSLSCSAVVTELQPLLLLSRWEEWRECGKLPHNGQAYQWDWGWMCTGTVASWVGLTCIALQSQKWQETKFEGLCLLTEMTEVYLVHEARLGKSIAFNRGEDSGISVVLWLQGFKIKIKDNKNWHGYTRLSLWPWQFQSHCSGWHLGTWDTAKKKIVSQSWSVVGLLNMTCVQSRHIRQWGTSPLVPSSQQDTVKQWRVWLVPRHMAHLKLWPQILVPSPTAKLQPGPDLYLWKWTWAS